ncbi:IclR family transcriptional regulator [Phytoactinopolyspora alkaliphila]|uniref:IclR family transcriptional regulator n=1 Tax=Phytoactinopolyspora alkaliphila TaxID=1783498 RepID=A0A6N9YTV0_9ACTN|nr:IclR family transcriptional regulator [Phytoactinopolyspora alkaliphila]NED98394.1 IclR family transcriptional regulator [Phytoactinopolyspora alkaliphila]
MTQSVDRAVEALMYVASQPRSVGDVANRLGVHSTTALRILHTLHGWRLLDKRPDGTYRLGAAVVELGQRALESLDVREIAAPFMQQLHAATGETVHLAILENGHVIYIDKIESKHPVRMYSRIGLMAPLHCTGVAKAILAHLPPADVDRLLTSIDLEKHTPHTLTTLEALHADFARSRERGYAMDEEEHELGIHCVAAPILHADGGVAASLSVSAPAMRVPRERLMTFVDPLRQAVAGAAAELGRPST